MKLSAAPMTERDLQRACIDLLHFFGARVAHFRAAKTTKGWRTAVEADGKGFPDLVILTRDNRLLVRELKCGKNKTSDEQNEWLEAFARAGIDVGVWTEGDMPDGIIDELRKAPAVITEASA